MLTFLFNVAFCVHGTGMVYVKYDETEHSIYIGGGYSCQMLTVMSKKGEAKRLVEQAARQLKTLKIYGG